MFDEKLHKEFSTKNDRPLSSYSYGSKKKVLWKCKTCGNEWSGRIAHRVNGAGCKICATKQSHVERNKKKPSISDTDPHIAKEWDDKQDVQVVSRGVNRKFQWKCQNGHRYMSSPNSRCLRGRGCPYCSGRLVTNVNRLSIVRPDLSKELLGDASQFCCNSSRKVRWKCSSCSHQWESTVNNRFRGRGCPQCSIKNSKPQRIIESCLQDNNINYTKEFRIPDCKNKRPLPFDFAIFKNDQLDFLLEYQGEQHFFPIWGKKEFQKRIHNDRIKEKYCQLNQITLKKINYWEQGQIKDILKS